MSNLRKYFQRYCQEAQGSNRMSLLCRLMPDYEPKGHWNKERFVNKKSAFIFKNQKIICYKCNKEVRQKLVVKRTKRTRHYHQTCYEKLFH